MQRQANSNPKCQLNITYKDKLTISLTIIVMHLYNDAIVLALVTALIS